MFGRNPTCQECGKRMDIVNWNSTLGVIDYACLECGHADTEEDARHYEYEHEEKDSRDNMPIRY